MISIWVFSCGLRFIMLYKKLEASYANSIACIAILFFSWIWLRAKWETRRRDLGQKRLSDNTKVDVVPPWRKLAKKLEYFYEDNTKLFCQLLLIWGEIVCGELAKPARISCSINWHQELIFQKVVSFEIVRWSAFLATRNSLWIP